MSSGLVMLPDFGYVIRIRWSYGTPITFFKPVTFAPNYKVGLSRIRIIFLGDFGDRCTTTTTQTGETFYHYLLSYPVLFSRFKGFHIQLICWFCYTSNGIFQFTLSTFQFDLPAYWSRAFTLHEVIGIYPKGKSGTTPIKTGCFHSFPFNVVPFP